MAATVRSGRAAALVRAIRSVLRAAIRAGGSSLRDYAQTDGALGEFQHRFAVYGREGAPCPCSGCNSRVKRIVQSGRSTFYCPGCQR
jgi:formamidopyrimidine-DNA glycosylase